MDKSAHNKSIRSIHIQKWEANQFSPQDDIVAIEEPLEINIAYGKGAKRTRKSVAITMRTPGYDIDLALGFLLTEGIISRCADVIQYRYIANQLEPGAQENVLLIDFDPDLQFDITQLNRHFYTSSSCGICGKASIDLVNTQIPYVLNKNYPKIKTEVLLDLPKQLLKAQETFLKTGGLHATALFKTDGQLILVREDVGRHNALDKLIGVAFQKEFLPLKEHILLLSGRISFELVQKALMAGISFIAAVGAPSSLALSLADEHNMTLVGFLKKDKFNLYCGPERVLS